MAEEDPLANDFADYDETNNNEADVEPGLADYANIETLDQNIIL